MARVMLVVEGDEVRRWIGETLKRAGHHVTRVDAFDSAMTLVSESYYDVLVCEVGSDGESGLSFAHEARRVDPEMQVVFVSGFAIVPLIVRERDDGALYDSLGAPVHLSQIASVIQGRIADAIA